MRKLASVMVSLVLAATSSWAQKPIGQLPPLTERVDVRVINVDATVIDPAGHPVSNLTAKDFVVLEDGKRQRITNFYAVEHSTVREDATNAAAAPAPQRFRRKAVLLVDNHFIDKYSRDAALHQVRDFIDADYASDYDWSIGTISGGVHVIQPFTSDKGTIHAALDRLLKSGVSASIVSAINAPGIESSQGRGATLQAQTEFDKSAAEMIDMDRTIRFASALDALRSSARAVIDACRAYSSVQGKKVIILVTGSMEIDNRLPEIKPGQLQMTPSENDREAGAVRETMIREANAANFNIYVINAAGVASSVVGFDVGTQRPDDSVLGEVRNLDSTAVALASQTGGEYLTSNVISKSIKTIDSVSSTYYSLGYSPAHPEDGQYHRIQVLLSKPGYKVLSRAGYVDASTDTRFEESMQVAVSSTLGDGSLPVHVSVGKRSTGTTASIPVTASLPLRLITTIRRGNLSVGRMHIYLSIFDQHDANVAFNHAVQQVELSDAQLQQIAASPESNFRYTMKVHLKPGMYRFVVALRDDISDEVGKASTTFDNRS
ncbi:MAG TPA: VWA domain-containing protein [Thermoanaerobaculia bacterium]|nr:VWA domain-containing protein [Thermoanaerobaculia bacterium]